MLDPNNQPEKITFATGAIRNADVAGASGAKPVRYDLLLANLPAMRRLAETYAEGSVKYGDENWRKGMPEKVLVNHVIAHIQAKISGDKNEDHLAHAAWNIITWMWLEETRPDLLDLQKSAQMGKVMPMMPMMSGEPDLKETVAGMQTLETVCVVPNEVNGEPAYSLMIGDKIICNDAIYPRLEGIRKWIFDIQNS